MSNSWNRWIAAACCAACFLAAGCSKPTAEAPPTSKTATAAPSTDDEPDRDEAWKPISSKPTIGYEHLFQLGTGAMNQQAFLFKLAVWPTTDRPLSGVLQVRTYGDVSGISGRGNNADILPLDGVIASKNSAAIFYYFLNSPAIRTEGLTPDDAGKKVSLAVVIQYTPRNTKSRWEPTEWILALRDGQISEVDRITATPEMQQWLRERGLPASDTQVAKQVARD